MSAICAAIHAEILLRWRPALARVTRHDNCQFDGKISKILDVFFCAVCENCQGETHRCKTQSRLKEMKINDENFSPTEWGGKSWHGETHSSPTERREVESIEKS